MALAFFLNDHEKLHHTLLHNEILQQPTLLIGVTYALLDFAEKYKMKLSNTIIMETGGMKGRREEMIREEVHKKLQINLGVQTIHSEYSMTELLSQAYSRGNGLYKCAPWMKVLIRDMNDPFSYVKPQKSGGVNVIDLANLNSCSFIETKDLGKIVHNTDFEIIGRFDNSDIRGCNLMVQ